MTSAGSENRPVVLGYDAVSPLGTDLDSQWQRACAGKSGIGPLTRFTLRDNFPVRIAGQVPEYDFSSYPYFASRDMALFTSPVFKYGLLTVHRSLDKSGIIISPDLAPRVGITFSSAVGGLDAIISADRLLNENNKLPHPFTNPNSCINMIGGKVSIMTGATGPIMATITACATGCTSMIAGAMMLQQRMADVVICGAVDFALIETILGGFATMNGAYHPEEGHGHDSPEHASRPFSKNRRGFVMAEGAGCVIIATRAFARLYGLKPQIEMAGWGMTADANHFVAPNYDTVKRCIAQSIKGANIAPADISAVNAHGTSTKLGDKVEADVLADIFGGRVPPVSANKSQTGHAMGASSAIETIFAMEGMLRDILLPTINYTPDPEIVIDCVPEGARRLPQEYVLKNSFGFGGCNSCIVLRRVA